MTNKSLTIAFIAIVVVGGAAISVWVSLRSRPISPSSLSPSSPAVSSAPSETNLPSREYIEARAETFKQLRKEQTRRRMEER